MSVSSFSCPDHRNVSQCFEIVAFCMLCSVYFMVSSPAFSLTTPIIRAAILLYDYCLTFVAEVERYWVVRRLSWGLGFFYLNRYLVLFGHIPIMVEFFWTSSNSKTTEVSILLLNIPSPRPGGNILMRSPSDVSIHPSLAVENGH